MSLEEAQSRLRVAEALNDLNEAMEDIRVKHNINQAEELEIITKAFHDRLSILSVWAKRAINSAWKGT